MPGCTLANFYIPFLTLGYSTWSKLLQTPNSSKTRFPYVVSTWYIFASKSSPLHRDPNISVALLGYVIVPALQMRELRQRDKGLYSDHLAWPMDFDSNLDAHQRAIQATVRPASK